MLRIIKVSGNSMLPTLYHNDYIIIQTVFKRPREGNIVLCQHPQLGQIIKRIKCVNDDHSFYVCGDNTEETTSSQQLGRIKKEQLVGTLVFKIQAPPSLN